MQFVWPYLTLQALPSNQPTRDQSRLESTKICRQWECKMAFLENSIQHSMHALYWVLTSLSLYEDITFSAYSFAKLLPVWRHRSSSILIQETNSEKKLQGTQHINSGLRRLQNVSGPNQTCLQCNKYCTCSQHWCKISLDKGIWQMISLQMLNPGCITMLQDSQLLFASVETTGTRIKAEIQRAQEKQRISASSRHYNRLKFSHGECTGEWGKKWGRRLEGCSIGACIIYYGTRCQITMQHFIIHPLASLCSR